jgi:hypothetical protein
MAGVADWLLGRRHMRVILMAALFPMPLLAVASAAIVALTAMRLGWRMALVDVAAAVVVVGILTALAQGFWLQISIGAAVTWAVAVLLGQLRETGSLNLAVQCAVLLGIIGTLAFTVLNPDPQAYWEDVLRDLAQRARDAGLEIGPADLLPAAAEFMTGMMSASAVASALAALFLACWWAGDMSRVEFGTEFRQLRMGRVLGLLAGVFGVLALAGLRPSVDDLLLVLGTGFVIQGLAVIHWHGAQRNWPRGWALFLYLPLALLPALAAAELLVLALLGLVDNGYRLRRSGGNLV